MEPEEMEEMPVAPETETDDTSEIKLDQITSGKLHSFWIDDVEPMEFNELLEDLSADVVIVGGGITGLSCAYNLLSEGKSVAIVEDGLIGSGETGRTTAHLVNALDDRYFELEKMFGIEGARLAAESHSKAISFIEYVVNEENIDCNFKRVPGYLFLHSSDNIESLEKELDATRNAGLNTEMVNNVPGLALERGPALKFPDQAVFHPMKYLKGLAGAIIKKGGKIFTKTHALKIDKNGIETLTGKRIYASNIIVATNTPINNKVIIHTKQVPYRTYVIAMPVKKDSLPDALWWDTGDHFTKWNVYPYHYIRTHNLNEEEDLLIVGGDDHKTGQPDENGMHHEEDRYHKLEDWTRKRFPDAGKIIYKWSGQVMEPLDSLAFIGRNPMDSENIYIVTGDSGNGMTHGTIAGILITDLISGRKNNWEEIYDPGRKTHSGLRDLLEESGNFISQYTDYVTGGDRNSIEEILPDEGAILRKGLHKLAVYKDPEGKITAFSAICPHLKCIVQWNNAEKTFDCPCHGSRFSCYGKIIAGPANRDLEPSDLPGKKASKIEFRDPGH